MSIRTVNRVIKKAILDNVVTGEEMADILKTASKGRLTTGETKKIGDMYVDGDSPLRPVPMWQSAKAYRFELDAAQKATDFFAEHMLPYGPTRSTVRQNILRALANQDYGMPLAEPPKTRHLHPIRLTEPGLLGTVQTAYLDTSKNSFYVASNVVAPHAPVAWYGPFALKPQPAPGLTAQRKAALLSCFEQLRDRGELEWQVGGMPFGVRFHTEKLGAPAHPYAPSLEVCIPTGPLNLPAKDPNRVDQVYFVESGGFCGIEMISGPHTVPVPVVCPQ